MPVAQKNPEPLEQTCYQIWTMREGWLVDPGTNWVWRFHRDDKAWVRDPKVFMDRGMAMPNGEPPLLKERRNVPQEDAETIWRNLKSMGWKLTEPLWGASAEP
jgi:hypothetical protein